MGERNCIKYLGNIYTGRLGAEQSGLSGGPYEVQRNIVSADLFQVVFTNDSGSLNVYRDGLHLPLAADPVLVPQVPACDPENLLSSPVQLGQTEKIAQ